MNEEIDVVGIYEWYRALLNPILARLDVTEVPAEVSALSDAVAALRTAFIEEVCPDPADFEESVRYPPSKK